MSSDSNLDLSVIYRDEFIIAVNKPSGMIVHRGFDRDPVTVADIVRDRIVGKPIHAIHRLDRGTSGVLVFALDSETARFLQEQIQAGKMYKSYLALVRGPMKEGLTLEHPIPNKKGGERVNATTRFRPISHKDRWSLVEAQPVTGRLHQIRRHLKHLSHPVVGDVRYGKGDINRLFRDEYGFHRLALHCHRLKLSLPDEGHVDLAAPVATDFRQLIFLMSMWPVVESSVQKSEKTNCRTKK